MGSGASGPIAAGPSCGGWLAPLDVSRPLPFFGPWKPLSAGAEGGARPPTGGTPGRTLTQAIRAAGRAPGSVLRPLSLPLLRVLQGEIGGKPRGWARRNRGQ